MLVLQGYCLATCSNSCEEIIPYFTSRLVAHADHGIVEEVNSVTCSDNPLVISARRELDDEGFTNPGGDGRLKIRAREDVTSYPLGLKRDRLERS